LSIDSVISMAACGLADEWISNTNEKVFFLPKLADIAGSSDTW
jgi:hypothetical protein